MVLVEKNNQSPWEIAKTDKSCNLEKLTVLQIGFFWKKAIHSKKRAKWEPFMRFYQVI